jgi:hypothetical protein
MSVFFEFPQFEVIKIQNIPIDFSQTLRNSLGLLSTIRISANNSNSDEVYKGFVVKHGGIKSKQWKR